MDIDPRAMFASRWSEMWGLSFSIFVFCKVITWWHQKRPATSARMQLGYLFAWPGMNAAEFLGMSTKTIDAPTCTESILAISNLTVGIGLILNSEIIRHSYGRYAAGCIGMAGIVLTLHFGLFHILSIIWRHNRVCATPLMNWPIKSQSLSEFWGRRWNLAFRDLTHRFVFMPLVRRLGPTAALLIAFAVSGAIHDIVISIPATSGLGLPTIYFIVQGIGVLFERSNFCRYLGLRSGLGGWAYCFAFIVLPCPLLFHAGFICNVIDPFLETIGAAI